MCSHADCRVEVLPDGQVEETHVFTDAQMRRFQDSIDRLLWKLEWVKAVHAEPVEWPTDLRLRGWGKGGD